jgi:hypothetical protein
MPLLLNMLISCVTVVRQFGPAAGLWNQQRIGLLQTGHKCSETGKPLSKSSESVTALVEKTHFILPDLPPGTARNVTSWNQLIGLSSGESRKSRTVQIKTSRPRPHNIQGAACMIMKNSQLETSDAALLGMLSNHVADEFSALLFPFNDCFELSLPRKDMKNCEQIKYSISSRRLMQNRDLLDRLHEIRALSREISGAATELEYEADLFRTEGHSSI